MSQAWITSYQFDFPILEFVLQDIILQDWLLSFQIVNTTNTNFPNNQSIMLVKLTSKKWILTIIKFATSSFSSQVQCSTYKSSHLLCLSCCRVVEKCLSAKKVRDAAGVEKIDQSSISLNDKVQQLLDLSQRRTVIKLSSKTFKELVKSQPKNYSVVVMFTALQSHRGCSICKQASDEFNLLANSYRYSPFFSTKMFFAMVDFDEGPDVFQVTSFWRVLLLNLSNRVVYRFSKRIFSKLFRFSKPTTDDHFIIVMK